MTEEEQKRLLAGLNRSDRVEWLPELEAGKPAFDYLLQELAMKSLRSNQRRNALLAIFKLRSIGNGDDGDAMQAFVQGAEDEDIRVRSEAVKLAIGLESLSQKRGFPGLLGEDQRAVLKGACNAGLESAVKELAEDFFS